MFNYKIKKNKLTYGKFPCIPPSTATEGDSKFYYRVEQVFVNENHLIGYFGPYIGDLHSDFVLTSPKYGVKITEIKNYSAKYLKTIPKLGKQESFPNCIVKHMQ